ncbi:prefoldin subunit alpha [Haloglomus salinum]|jgi:prefoldin alpha subunit|uniref:prefoldin subunit alpha n=1 Tax=Haloglomus salinum TaxID=2962673 RepID=UPI0020CA075A|nr:prefoldin subunit alpha [Haloglomus salinum]
MSLGGGGGGGMDQLQQQLQALEQEKEAVQEEIEGVQADKTDIDEAIDALEELETNDTVKVPLGGDAYVSAELGSIEEIVVSIGGGFAAERDQEGAIATLESKKDVLDERIAELEAEIDEIEEQTEQVEQKAQQAQQQQMQQMMQQQQQMEGGEGDEDE